MTCAAAIRLTAPLAVLTITTANLACGVGLPAVARGSKEDLVAYDRAVIVDGALASAGDVLVEGVTARRTTSGTLEVTAMLRNQGNDEAVVEARTRFFDTARVEVDGPTGWSRVFLTPRGIATYRALSAKAGEVAHYYVELRGAR